MLVLSRKKNESILLGDAIELTIVDIRGDNVRVGINAPMSIPVHRQEVYDAINREHPQSRADGDKSNSQCCPLCKRSN